MAGDHFVGDDLAQMWIDDQGIIRSINPECGIFGIVEDVNWEGDPKLMECLRRPGTEVIWSNVLIDDQTGSPLDWQRGRPARPGAANFQGPWEKGMLDANGKPVPISHPNARATLSSTALANYSPQAEDPQGGGNPGDHLQRAGQRYHAAGLGGANPGRGRGHRCLYRVGGHGHRSRAQPASSGPPGPTHPLYPGRWATTWTPSSNFFRQPRIATESSRSWPA